MAISSLADCVYAETYRTLNEITLSEHNNCGRKDDDGYVEDLAES